MSTEVKTEQKDVIDTIQQSLGTPQEKHFTKKEPLLKLTVGQITSNLSLAQYYDESTQSYRDPEPSYSLYFMERIKDQSGNINNKITSIPLPKDSESIKAFADHLLKVAKALEGIELKSSSSDVDDLDLALSRLKAFKSKGA